jgi:hypothetical protein
LRAYRSVSAAGDCPASEANSETAQETEEIVIRKRTATHARRPKSLEQRTYEFVLILEGITFENFDSVSEALYESGCDDATPGISNGIPMLIFDRQATSFKEAISTALHAVRKASKRCRIPLKVIRLDANNLATLTQIAVRSGKSRQAIHHYLAGKRGEGNFPLPLQQPDNTTLLWRWFEVAQWLYDNDLANAQTVQDAQDAEVFSNLILINALQDTKSLAEIQQLVASG